VLRVSSLRLSNDFPKSGNRFVLAARLQTNAFA